MPTTNFDASLTTLRRQQRALGAYRNSFASGFPNGNAVRPEQPNTQTGDVPVNARIGVGLCCQTPDNNPLQSPANIKTNKF